MEERLGHGVHYLELQADFPVAQPEVATKLVVVLNIMSKPLLSDTKPV